MSAVATPRPRNREAVPTNSIDAVPSVAPGTPRENSRPSPTAAMVPFTSPRWRRRCRVCGTALGRVPSVQAAMPAGSPSSRARWDTSGTSMCSKASASVRGSREK